MEGHMENKSLSVKQKAAFGFGAFGKDIVYMLVASFLLNYYNVVLGVDSVFVGFIMMLARIFDAFNDPLMGIIVAKTKTKWGRYRPWILAGTVMNAVTIYALFATPQSMAESGMRIWLIIFYFAWGITYTLMDIPFWSMIPAITNAGSDREQLTSLARTCSGVGDAIPTVLTTVIVPILGGGAAIANMRIGYKWWALIIAVVFVISEVVTFLAVPEKPVNVEAKATKVGDMFKALFKNDQAMSVIISIILVYTAINICGNLVLYFFQFDVGNPAAYSVFTAVAFGAQVVVMMLIPALRKKLSKNFLYIAGFGVQIIGYLVILLMAYTNIYSPETWYVLCVPGVLIYAGYGTLNVIMTVFLSDSVDYGEVKYGSRDESVLFSMQTFSVKLASGIAVFLAGYVIRWVHLDVDATAQTMQTLQGLRMWMTLPAIALLICGVIVYIKFYKLDDKKMEEITSQLHR